MAKIVNRALAWTPVAGADGYNLYYDKHVPGLQFDYDTTPKVDVQLPATNEQGDVVLALTDFPELLALPEDVYDLAVTAYDKAGNESDFAEVESVPLDFVPPAPVTNLRVVVVT